MRGQSTRTRCFGYGVESIEAIGRAFPTAISGFVQLLLE